MEQLINMAHEGNVNNLQPWKPAAPVDTRTFQQYDKNNPTAQKQIGSSAAGVLLPNNPYRAEAEQKVVENVAGAMSDPMIGNVSSKMHIKTDYPNGHLRRDAGTALVDDLINLGGENGEHTIFRHSAAKNNTLPASNKYTQEEWDSFKKDIASRGIEYPLWIRNKSVDGPYVIAEGNHRLLAAQQLGIKEVPIQVSTMIPERVTWDDITGVKTTHKHPQDKLSNLFRP